MKKLKSNSMLLNGLACRLDSLRQEAVSVEKPDANAEIEESLGYLTEQLRRNGGRWDLTNDEGKATVFDAEKQVYIPDLTLTKDNTPCAVIPLGYFENDTIHAIVDIINDLPIDTEELFQEMTGYLAANYYPAKNDDDTIHELACGEFFRIREIICRKYGFDEDLYIRGDGTSPFDFVCDNIEQEVYKRIKYDAEPEDESMIEVCECCGGRNISPEPYDDGWSSRTWCSDCEDEYHGTNLKEYKEAMEAWWASLDEPKAQRLAEEAGDCRAWWQSLSFDQKRSLYKKIHWDNDK